MLRGALAQVVNNGLVQGRTTARTRVVKLPPRGTRQCSQFSKTGYILTRYNRQSGYNVAGRYGTMRRKLATIT